jgi:pyrimidine-nucleoside phosphorylase
VGNALEVKESIEVLRDGGAKDLREHCIALAAHMLRLARRDTSEYALSEYMAEAADHLRDGSALEKLRVLVRAQGGDVSVIDDPEKLPKAAIIEEMRAAQSGYVEQLSALNVGIASVELGAGRERKEDGIDHAVGIMVHKKVGDAVGAGEVTFTLHANDAAKLALAKARLNDAIVYGSNPVAPLPMFYNIIQ